MSEKSVYLIDDDADVLGAYRDLLAGAGFQVHCFSSADAFLPHLTPSTRGCIVLDIRMPGLSGLQLQQRIQQMGVAIPIVVISAHSEIPLCVQAMRLGACDFLEKPF